MHYFKSNRGCLSTIFCLWSVSSKCPVIISQQTGTPLDLVMLSIVECPDEIAVRPYRSLPRDFLGKSLILHLTLLSIFL